MADTDRDRMVEIALGRFGAARHSPVRLAVIEATDRLIAAGYTAPVDQAHAALTNAQTLLMVARARLTQVEASRRDWAAEADAVDQSWRRAGELRVDDWRLEATGVVPCCCTTDEQTSALLAAGFTLPLCAEHHEEVSG